MMGMSIHRYMSHTKCPVTAERTPLKSELKSCWHESECARSSELKRDVVFHIWGHSFIHPSSHHRINPPYSKLKSKFSYLYTKMVFLHFPSGHTDEELMLRAKYAKLRKKKKALQAYQNPKPEPEKVNLLKKPLEPKDAKEYAKKLIMSGKISVANKGSSQKTFFKKPQGLVRKLTETRASAIVAPMPNPQGGTFVTSSSVTGVSSGGFQYKAFASSIPDNSSSTSVSRVSRVEPMPKMRRTGVATGSSLGVDPVPGPSNSNSSNPSSSQATPGPSTSGTVTGYFIPKKTSSGFGGPSVDYRPKQGNTIYVRATGITEDMCREAFRSIGQIVNISMELDKNCGFVTFSSLASAEKAIQEVNGTYVSDVQLQVSYARHQPVTEMLTDTSGAAAWTAAAANQSQKATHKDKRNQEVYGQDFPF